MIANNSLIDPDRHSTTNPSRGLFVIGNFNKLPNGTLTSQYRLKNAKSATRGEKVVHEYYSNAAIYYKIRRILPHVSKSDQKSVFISLSYI